MIIIRQSKGFFERERCPLTKLVAAATVRRVTPDPNMSGEYKSGVITSLLATAGTVLRLISANKTNITILLR